MTAKEADPIGLLALIPELTLGFQEQCKQLGQR